jgi:hypothetical protein
LGERLTLRLKTITKTDVEGEAALLRRVKKRGLQSAGRVQVGVTGRVTHLQATVTVSQTLLLVTAQVTGTG